MQIAIDLAAKARGRTSPNPMVGAVIVKGNKIISSGYHRKAGTAHAEVIALRKAGPLAKGATLYVNLEPCCHTEKRTPPCTKTIIEAGIQKVVVAMSDPNPSVSGRGLRALRRAGITTESGILRKEARHLNEFFITYISTRRPFVILKIAQSLDGKIATAGGESKWITGSEARKAVHILRGSADALLVGRGTVEKDNPSLDCRIRGGRNPYRIIVDSSLNIPMQSKVLHYHDGKTIIATTKKASKNKISRIEKLGCRVLIVKEKDSRVDLQSLMQKLGKCEITSVMIEGGSSISASALQNRIVHKAMFFTAPKIIGGSDSIPSIGGSSPARLSKAVALKDLRTSRIGDDVLLEGYVQY
jgi:diaminohydroxyphosphoribosylaminopyrimidine deaminase/5-amino-6-(5-phosphoribosylamino)uracil reductase